MMPDGINQSTIISPRIKVGIDAQYYPTLFNTQFPRQTLATHALSEGHMAKLITQPRIGSFPKTVQLSPYTTPDTCRSSKGFLDADIFTQVYNNPLLLGQKYSRAATTQEQIVSKSKVPT
jgi:hypothetical protein